MADFYRRRPTKFVYLCTERRRAKLTQEALAAASGVSQPRISALELQRANPTPRIRTDLARALNVTDPALLRFGPNPRTLANLRSRRRRAAGRQERATAAEKGRR